MEHIFITGGAGFLGWKLVKILLNETDSKLYLLVRQNSHKTVNERIADLIDKSYKGKKRRDAHRRIEIVKGDITEKNLGMKKAQMKELSETIDTIYHSAALCDFNVPMPVIGKINIDGTKNVLDFAAPKKYELVLAVEVIEHIKDDAKAIKNISSLLKPKGFFLLTVPINEQYRTDFDDRSGHIRRYSEEDLINKLKKAGFNIIRIKYFNFPLLWLWYFNIYLPYSNKKSRNERKKLPFYVHFLRIFNKIFLVDLLFNSKKATNVMVLAQKN